MFEYRQAFPSIAEDGVTPVFNNLMQQHLVERNEFSFYLSKTPGSSASAMVLGSVNPKYCTGSFSYFPLVERDYWSIDMDDISVNGQRQGVCSFGCMAIVDTDTSLIAGTIDVIQPLLNLINVHEDCSNVYSNPIISFITAGKSFVLTPQDYVIKITSQGKTQCFAGLQTIDMNRSSGFVILGDVFVSTYYTVFDYQASRVGFSKSNQYL